MRVIFQKQQVPWVMASARAAMGPLMIAGQACGWSGAALAGMIVAALLSDIFDGVLARRWQCDTAYVRLFDSMADTVFYAGVAVALWMREPQLLREHELLLGVLVSMEAARFALELAKFGKPSSYHSYLAKAWGLMLAVAMIATFVSSHAGGLLTAALALGIVCDAEGLAMSVVLPVWRKDVKTLSAALRIRLIESVLLSETARNVLRDSDKPHARGGIAKKAVTAMLAFCLAVPAFAGSRDEAVYMRGSVPGVTPGLVGMIDTDASNTLIFHAVKPETSILIPYNSITKFRYDCVNAHHLGWLPALLEGIVRPRQKEHIFTVDYRDSHDATQVVVFEISKQEPRFLMELLTERTDMRNASDWACR